MTGPSLYPFQNETYSSSHLQTPDWIADDELTRNQNAFVPRGITSRKGCDKADQDHSPNIKPKVMENMEELFIHLDKGREEDTDFCHRRL